MVVRRGVFGMSGVFGMKDVPLARFPRVVIGGSGMAAFVDGLLISRAVCLCLPTNSRPTSLVAGCRLLVMTRLLVNMTV